MFAKRHLIVLIIAALTAIGFTTFAIGNAGAWGCGPGVKCPTTTTTPVNTTIVQSTTVPETTVPDMTTSTPTTVPEVTTTTGPLPPPEVSLNPPSIERPPEKIKLAG